MVVWRLMGFVCYWVISADYYGSEGKKLPHIQLEQHHVDIDLERNRSPLFKFIPVTTQVEGEWGSLPEPPEYPEKKSCKIKLEIDLTEFDFSTIQLCLFKEEIDKQLFTEDAEINIFGETYTPGDIYDDAQVVSGFIRGNANSKVFGYLIDGNFYGSIRFFDTFRLHHVVFYVEPKDNAKVYDSAAAVPTENAILFEYIPRLNENDPPSADDYDDTTAAPPVRPSSTPASAAPAPPPPPPPPGGSPPPPPPPPGGSPPPPPPPPGGSPPPPPPPPGGGSPPPPAPPPGGSPPPPPPGGSPPPPAPPPAGPPPPSPSPPGGGPSPSSSTDTTATTTSSPAPPATTSTEPPTTSSTTTPSTTSTDPSPPTPSPTSRRKRSIPLRPIDDPSRELDWDSDLKWLFGNYDEMNINERSDPVPEPEHQKFRRQTKDQSQYSHDNLKSDNDIVHSYRFQAGITKHNMFDMRRSDTYLCELCIWIQPNFAHRFALGGRIQHGAAEVIDLIEFLNWIFRTQDFDQDGLPENIGFVIRSLHINDLFRVTKTETQQPHPGRPGTDDSSGSASAEYYFSENIQTVTPKSALALARKHFQTVFKSCCASLGFIYHNMAPSISATNLRGICTTKNIALISGLLHSNKIGKYDVLRGLFHAVGHLFGGHHDDVTNLRCHETSMYRFLNPFPLHPVQQLNVGIRSNSFRLSRCSKDHITQFLSSNGIHCLIQVNETYCGNGIEEEGEECDCGGPWQCHLQADECCGEADTFAGCQITDPYKTQCLRPRVWKKRR